MPPESHSPLPVEHLIDLLERYLQSARRATKALINHDLPEFEQSLEDQRDLTGELSRLGVFSVPPDVRDAILCSRLEPLVREIQHANRTNLALTKNGLEFSESMLRILLPPLTYESLAHQPGGEAVMPAEILISITG